MRLKNKRLMGMNIKDELERMKSEIEIFICSISFMMTGIVIASLSKPFSFSFFTGLYLGIIGLIFPKIFRRGEEVMGKWK